MEFKGSEGAQTLCKCFILILNYLIHVKCHSVSLDSRMKSKIRRINIKNISKVWEVLHILPCGTISVTSYLFSPSALCNRRCHGHFATSAKLGCAYGKVQLLHRYTYLCQNRSTDVGAHNFRANYPRFCTHTCSCLCEIQSTDFDVTSFWAHRTSRSSCLILLVSLYKWGNQRLCNVHSFWAHWPQGGCNSKMAMVWLESIMHNTCHFICFTDDIIIVSILLILWRNISDTVLWRTKENVLIKQLSSTFYCTYFYN